MTENKLSLTMKHLEEMTARGWSAAAIAKLSDVNQITVGNIKNGKASRVTDKVHDKIAALKTRIDAGQVEMPRRGRKPAAGSNSAAGSKPVTGSKSAAGSKPVTGSKSAAGSPAAAAANKAAKAGQRGNNSPSAVGSRLASAVRAKAEITDDFSGMINRQYVPVDITKLQGMIDQLITRFTDAANELEAIKEKLKL